MIKNKKFNIEKIFPLPKSVGKRNWGEEILLALIPKILSLKRLKIKKKNRGGLQYHRLKNECGVVISGKLLVKFDLGNGKLKSRIIKKGQAFHFPPGLIHQEEALTNVEIVEASTPHFNDRVRVEEKYGYPSDNGMPSTKKKDIIIK